MLDHALALTFAIGFPLVATPLYARRRPLLRSGDSTTRRREYRETILWLVSMGLATLVVWLLADRDLALLGLVFHASWQSLLSLAVALIIGGLLFLQVRGVHRDPTTQEAARKALEPVKEYLPATSQEARLFRGVSVSAGIGEEIFYRGFLLWYLTQFMSLPWAIGVSSILFGLAHVMHGVQASVRATITGFILAGLYVVSGALWASILLHTAIDLSSGEMGLAAFGTSSSVSRDVGLNIQ